MQEVIRLDLNGVNCYLLRKDKNFLLVDTGGHMLILRNSSRTYCSKTAPTLRITGLMPGYCTCPGIREVRLAYWQKAAA